MKTDAKPSTNDERLNLDPLPYSIEAPSSQANRAATRGPGLDILNRPTIVLFSEPVLAFIGVYPAQINGFSSTLAA
jgi:hypothetical protein